MNNRKKVVKRVIWVCDKERCGAVNPRNIDDETIIIDDYCDLCKKHIHEPNYIELTNDRRK